MLLEAWVFRWRTENSHGRPPPNMKRKSTKRQKPMNTNLAAENHTVNNNHTPHSDEANDRARLNGSRSPTLHPEPETLRRLEDSRSRHVPGAQGTVRPTITDRVKMG